ncbi:RNA-binding protein [Radiobacillus sp. PE A8.2]|uniref:YlmH family RNA-binding protein n=1 Tax=Radiobacillus sp. PE A8.2 TaxID=3380349 RepID=UPI00388F402C
MDLYQHYRKEEHPFIDQVLTWKDEVERTYQPKLSDFLHPREQAIFASVIGNNDELSWSIYGGDEQAERKRAILAPYYEQIETDDYSITLLQAEFPDKFVTLTHPDVLGAFLSLGIKRKKLGDLIVDDGIVQIVLASEIESYVEMNLTSIKNAKVSFKEQPLSALLDKKETWESNDTTISSLRLDVFVKEVYRISRQQAANYIQKGLVKVNFQIIENPAFQIEVDDLISVRGLGRSALTEIHGLSKKDKWKITFKKLK